LQSAVHRIHRWAEREIPCVGDGDQDLVAELAIRRHDAVDQILRHQVPDADVALRTDVVDAGGGPIKERLAGARN
jgi:hypothetical protein